VSVLFILLIDTMTLYIKPQQWYDTTITNSTLYTIFPSSLHQILATLSEETKKHISNLFSQKHEQEKYTNTITTSTTCSRNEAIRAIDNAIACMHSTHGWHNKADITIAPWQDGENIPQHTQHNTSPATSLITIIEADLWFCNWQPTNTLTKKRIMTIIKHHVTTMMNNLAKNNTITPPTKGRFGTILVPFIEKVENDSPTINHTIKFQSMIDYADIVLTILKYLMTFCNPSQQSSSTIALCNESLLVWDNAYGKYEPDPRVTMWGQRIRKTNIDELLQLILIKDDYLTIRGRLWKKLGRHIFFTKETWEKINSTTNIDLAGIRPCVPHYFTTLSKLYEQTNNETIWHVLKAIKTWWYAWFIPLTYALKGNYDIYTTNAAIASIKDELSPEQKKNFEIILFHEAMKNKFWPFRGHIFAWLIR